MDRFSSVILQPLIYPPLPRELTGKYFRLESLFKDFTAGDASDCSSDRTSKNSFGDNVSVLSVYEGSSNEKLREVDKILHSSTEVAATLLFTNGKTLLHEAHSKEKDVKIEALCFALHQMSVLYYIKLHFVPLSSSIGHWTRNLLNHVLSSTRIVGYQLNEVLSTVISYFEISDLSVLQWTVFDVGLASLLLQPDNAVHSYHQLLARYNLHPPSTSGVHCLLVTVYQLMNHLCHCLHSNGLWTLFIELEMKLLPLVAVMESHGLRVDIDLLKRDEEVLKIKVQEIAQTIYSIVGYPFAINSVQQLRKILYEDLKLDQTCPTSLDRTAVCGHTSTSEAMLIKIQDYHPLPKLILEYRQTCKLKAILSNLITHAESSKGSIKPCWQTLGSSTGRMICFNPVLTHSLLMLELRSLPDKTAPLLYLLLSVAMEDFRSIELCLLAHVSGDNKLISVLTHAKQTGGDIFKLLASEWLGMSQDSISQKERERTKRVVYSLIYGMGKEKLSQILDISPESAQKLTASFLSKYSGVKGFIARTIEHCRKTKFCSTLCGRLRWFDAINSSNFTLRTSAERQCVNFVIQGSAADVCKLSMLKIHEAIIKKMISGRLLIQVHDELVYEVSDKHTQLMIEQLKEVMESKHLLAGYTQCSELSVPLSVKIFAGKQWSTN